MSNSKGYLIMESANTITPQVIEDTEDSTRFKAELQEAEKPNRNGRIYGKELINSAINAISVKEKLKHKAMYGEAGHPLSDDKKRQLYIDQGNISHIVTEMYWEGNKLMATIETAQTRTGLDMQGLIRQGSDVAFSMRGMSGSVRRDGDYFRVFAPLLIVTYDWVIFPSHQESYMIREDVNNIKSDKLLSLEESANIRVINRGILTPYNASEILTYVTENSDNVRSLAESFNFEIGKNSKTSYNTNDQMLSIKNDTEVLKIFLEESIKVELDGFYSGLLG